MEIQTAKLIESGVLLNGNISILDDNTGHIRDSYNKWLSEGNTPEPQYTQTDLDNQKASGERLWRDNELNKADIELNKVQDGMGTGLVSQWRKYRCDLRNYPASTGFPYGERPTSPID